MEGHSLLSWAFLFPVLLTGCIPLGFFLLYLEDKEFQAWREQQRKEIEDMWRF